MLTPDEKRVIFGKVGYEPSPEQWAVHEDPALVRLVAGGERAGKSRLAAAEVTAHHIDGALFWLIAKDYSSARGEFSHLVDDFTKLEAIERNGLSMPDQGAWTMHLRSGVEITTVSADDPLKIATKAPAGIVLCEAGQLEFSTFLRAWTRTAEGRARGEGWLLLAGTFEKSRLWYRELFHKGQQPLNEYGLRSHSLPTWSNRAVFPGGREDPAIQAYEAGLGPDVFAERFGGVPAAREGVVFPEFRETTHVMPLRFGPVETDMRDEAGWVLPEKAPLEVWIDPGYAGGYAVEFVCIQGGRVYVVDEIFAQGKTGQEVILEAQSKRIWDRVQRGVIDIAGSQHHAMKSQYELWQHMAGLSLSMNAVPIADGINRHRTFLVDPFTKTPRIYFDPRAKNAIWEHSEGYRYHDGSPVNRDARELPIDAHNHACKAIAYGLVARFGYVDGDRPREVRRPVETELQRWRREVIDEVMRPAEEDWLGL